MKDQMNSGRCSRQEGIQAGMHSKAMEMTFFMASWHLDLTKRELRAKQHSSWPLQ